MYVHGDSLDDEIRLTIEAAVDIANAITRGAGPDEVQRLLIDHGFGSAESASPIEVVEAYRSLTWLSAIVLELPSTGLAAAVDSINRALAGRAVTPKVTAHDGSSLHIHWTSSEVPLGGRVVVDMLMALAQALCDYGVERFGLCGAEGCDAVFFDTTKNRSRRFCNDPRCASRTHTANHRARHRDDA